MILCVKTLLETPLLYCTTLWYYYMHIIVSLVCEFLDIGDVVINFYATNA